MNVKFRMWMSSSDDEQLPYDGVWRDLRVLEGEWEKKLEFLERDDIAGMVRYFERLLEKRGGENAVDDGKGEDIGLLRDLSEAYILDGQYQKVVELLREPHARYPDFLEFQFLILDALFAQGLDETAFQWCREVPVVRLGERVLSVCREYLFESGEPRPIDQLYAEVMMLGYCAFTLDDLLALVERDPRFRVLRKCPGDPWPEVDLEVGAAWTV